ncbi:Down syndrome cell adhesion molecule-like protein Dscam2 [Apis mellifera carnica]|nr:Down syndrome cell adhesion molecule-like protein Dscam2 [Apis mellifera carnica]
MVFLVPPRWTVEPIDQNAVVGHGVSIACQAEGFPIPTVTWKQSIAGPQVSVKTQQESVRRGESVTLRCEAEGDAPLDLSWRARDSRVDPNYDVRYTIDNQKVSGRVISELRITQANHIDRGDYTCVATNAYGHARAGIKLLVQEPPNFPRNLHVAEQGSRSLLLAWSSPSSEQDPAHANSPITKYIVQYKEAQGSGNDQSVNITRVGITENGDGSYRLTGLRKYTQYSIVVKAFNNKGDGPGSDPVTVQTLEDVPSASPQNVACAALTGQNIQVTWKPPPSDKVHGVVQGYKLLYEAGSAVLEQQAGRETKISHALSTVLHGLSPYTNYTVQVLAYTRAGEGVTSSPVSCTTEETVPDAPERVKAVTSNEDAVVISWLPPRRPNGILTKYTVHIRVLDQGQEVKTIKSSLPAQNLHHEATGLKQRESYEAWVTASTKIGQGPRTPVIKLQLSNTVPPTPPTLLATGTTTDAVQLQWKQGDNGGAPIKGFLLAYRREFSEWEEVMIDRKANTHLLEGLQCGTRYQFTLAAFNRIGSGSASKIETAKTNGTKPIPPIKHQLIKANQTFVTLELNSWQDGGCPLLYFVVEYRRLPGDWLLLNLDSGTKYELRVTAYNNAGSTQAEYLFTTLSPTGSNRIHDEHPPETEETSLLFDAHVLAPSVISLLAVFLTVAGVCFCLKTHAERSGRANDPSSQTQAALENKHNMEQREQYYATVRKPGQQSPCREVSALERIPEYSEDIYPYATFNLPEQENLSANPMRQAFYYERSETMLQGNQCDMEQYTKVRGRARRKSKSFKSESEEYDTLGSDSDTEIGKRLSRPISIPLVDSQESRSNGRHGDGRSSAGDTAPRDEALGIRDAFVFEGSVAESAWEAWVLRSAGQRSEPEEVGRVVVPAGGTRIVQNGKEGRGLGQRAVYVGTETADRFHGRARDQRGRVRYRHEAEAPQEEDGFPF